MNPDEQQIRELITTWMTSTFNGEIQTVLDLMTDDVVFMVPGGEPFGKEEFIQMTKAASPKVRYKGKSTIIELKIVGDIAYTRTRLMVTVIPLNNTVSPTYRAGYVMSIFQKDDNGKWRLSRDANLL